MKTVQTALPIPNPQDWADIRDVVKLTGLVRGTVYAYVKDRRLRAYKIGTYTVFWRADVEELAKALGQVRGTRTRGCDHPPVSWCDRCRDRPR